MNWRGRGQKTGVSGGVLGVIAEITINKMRRISDALTMCLNINSYNYLTLRGYSYSDSR